MTALQLACERRGLIGQDQGRAITAYRSRGPMTAADRRHMRRLSASERSAWAAARWGSDGARVGLIAFEAWAA